MSVRARLTRVEQRSQAHDAGATMTPAEGAEARRKIAAMVDQAHEATEAGDQVAVYRLSGITAGLAQAVRPHADPDEQLGKKRTAADFGDEPAPAGTVHAYMTNFAPRGRP